MLKELETDRFDSKLIFDLRVHYFKLSLQNIDRFQGGDVIFIRYLKKEKWGIAFFLIVYIALFISSYLLIGGPATIEGPICVFLGFCIVQFLKYRAFKKEERNKRRNIKSLYHRL
ncbi:hypothetical protein BK049_07115 [Bacillus xiamenensis]|uniref:Uncharacterized protein n=1 Tax=Bacillus xiamenensis TaxID=1178537 RepID=A0AAC9NBB8_9BACI|nr:MULTISPECIES: hypothetical protein [Bacillus]AOZ88492.1 hypothetical protein BK049_07115 [Bacillus xiamenensis]EKF34445.1 hypothetical protein BA1_15176 [Bacillus xiamenensis]MBG9910091.1 hypothetical protein [Bacillus xiamenensis]MCW1837237.1 hypothetical protein [Bacillus xiamenensis]MCY9575722.1 hypothetical protein [Bacillus xiamenensis]